VCDACFPSPTSQIPPPGGPSSSRLTDRLHIAEVLLAWVMLCICMTAVGTCPLVEVTCDIKSGDDCVRAEIQLPDYIPECSGWCGDLQIFHVITSTITHPPSGLLLLPSSVRFFCVFVCLCVCVCVISLFFFSFCPLFCFFLSTCS
jgi:hypothetical protein